MKTIPMIVVCVLLGDLTFNLAVRADRKHIAKITGETVKRNNQSIDALQASDADAYRSFNKMANDAFGRMFFLQIALSAASLWPIPFALAWMQYRFFGVDFPFAYFDFSLGFTGMYLLLYILLRVGFGSIKGKLPFFRGAKEIFGEVRIESGRMKSWREFLAVPATGQKVEKPI